MTINRVFSSAIAIVLAIWALSSPARADFLYDLSVTGTSWTGSGSIGFNTLSGSSTSGVSSFSFTSSNFGPSVDYTLGDISSISWSIDSSGDLTSLLLTTNPVPFMTSPPDATALLLTTDNSSSDTNPSPCQPTQSGSGSIICDETGPGGGVILTNHQNAPDGDLSAVPVPEPGSLALFAPALLGLAFFYRRRKCA